MCIVAPPTGFGGGVSASVDTYSVLSILGCEFFGNEAGEGVLRFLLCSHSAMFLIGKVASTQALLMLIFLCLKKMPFYRGCADHDGGGLYAVCVGPFSDISIGNQTLIGNFAGNAHSRLDWLPPVRALGFAGGNGGAVCSYSGVGALYSTHTFSDFVAHNNSAGMCGSLCIAIPESLSC